MELRKFDIERLANKNPTILVFGRKNIGKTTLIKDLIKNKTDIQYTLFNTKFDEKAIEEVISWQKQTEPLTSHWIVLDDIIYDNYAMKTKAMRWLFMNGMCYKMGLLCSLQYPIPPSLTTNVDYVFLYSVPKYEEVYRMFCGFMDNIDDFKSMYNTVTSQPHTCLVIDLTTHASERFYWYSSCLCS